MIFIRVLNTNLRFYGKTRYDNLSFYSRPDENTYKQFTFGYRYLDHAIEYVGELIKFLEEREDV